MNGVRHAYRDDDAVALAKAVFSLPVMKIKS
jgi:hypothetical protein